MTEQDNNKTLIEKQREELYAFLDTIDPDSRARAIAVFLVKQAKKQLPPDQAEGMVEVYKSRAFIKNITSILKARGTKGLIDEMVEIGNEKDPNAVYKFLTGEDYVEQDPLYDDVDPATNVDITIDA